MFKLVREKNGLAGFYKLVKRKLVEYLESFVRQIFDPPSQVPNP